MTISSHLTNINQSNSRSNPDISSVFPAKTLDFEHNPFEQSFAQSDDNITKVNRLSNEDVSKGLGKSLPKPQSDTHLENMARNIDQQTMLNFPRHQVNAVKVDETRNNDNTSVVFTEPSGSAPSKNIALSGETNLSKQMDDKNVLKPPASTANGGFVAPVLSPGGSKKIAQKSLPPLPGILSPGGSSLIATPGIWNSLFLQTPGIPQQSNQAQNSNQQTQQSLPQYIYNLQQQSTQNNSFNLSNLGALSPSTITLAQQQQQNQCKEYPNAQKSSSIQQNGIATQQQDANTTQSNQQQYQPMSSSMGQQLSTNSLQNGMMDSAQTQNKEANIIPAQQQQQLYNFLLNAKSSGLTPNESSLRTGLTPGPTLFSKPETTFGKSQISVNVPNSTGVSKGLQLKTESPVNSFFPTLVDGSVKKRKDSDTNLSPKQKRTKNMATSSPGTTSSEKIEIKENISSSSQKDVELPQNKPKRRKNVSAEEKRKNFLERNRVAASKCRQRKKEMINNMKADLDKYRAENEALREQVGTLREHALTLRTILFAHRDCSTLGEQVGGIQSLNTVLNATNYVAQIPEAHKVPESINADDVSQLLNGSSTNVQAAVAAAVAHTTNKAIERQDRLT
ncbi:Transcription factor atf1 [Pichia kudriavzevii]|uniref:Transcription factor atf1 n=1 Tax=Pichia kudriavzevii TaxID=4909 RepID=A0A1V2LJC1_PICKU|nr:Transcription factor atf1 [Pichia kudriavzevii]